MRLLAVNQDVGAGAESKDGRGKSSRHSTATLEVTPKQAEMLGLATTLGKLSLVLRSNFTDTVSKDIEGKTTYADLVQMASRSMEEKKKGITIFNGISQVTK